MVCFLLSDLASEVTGQIYTVNAGRIAVWNQPIEVREMRKDGRWRVDEIASALRRGRPGADADPRAPAGDGSRGQGEGQSPTADRSPTLRGGGRDHAAGAGSTRRRSPGRGDAVRVAAVPRRRVRRLAAHDRGVPRRARHRDPARAPVGQPARGRQYRPRANDGLARGRRRSPTTRTVCRSTATCSASRSRCSRRTRRASSPASTTARTPTSCARSRFPHTSPSTCASTRRAGSTSSRRSSRRRTRPCRSRSAGIRSSALPNAPRAEWELRWPACEHVEVDDRVIPTGRAHPPRRATRTDRRPHVRRPLRARRRPHVRDLGRRRAQPPHAHAAVRPVLPVRAAVRAARSATSSRSNR